MSSLAIVRTIIKSVLGVIAVVFWLAGLVVAKGFWTTAFCYFPPFAWYLVVEKAIQNLEWLQWLNK